jgi:hypothetical protein
MRVYVDFSVFTASQALGNVHGGLELEIVPRKGETLNFANLHPTPVPLQVQGFTPHLRVEDVFPSPQGAVETFSLSLSDVEVASLEIAQKIFAYFEKGFGLFVDRYDV